MNGLVQEQNGPSWLDGAGFLANAVNAGNAFESGDIATGVSELINIAMSAVGAVIDPIGWLASSVAGWVMEHVEPLREWLDVYAGDPAAVESFAGTWENVATAVTDLVAEWKTTIGQDLDGWDSGAVDAFRGQSLELVGYFDGLGELCRGLSDGVYVAARAVDAVRSITRDLIATTIGTIISVVADCLGPQVVILGAHAVVVVGKHVTTTTYKVLSFTEKFILLLQKMSTAASLLVTLAQTLMMILGNINTNLAKLADRMNG